MINAVSIDVEEWFCVSNFEGVIARDEWNRLESRVEPSTEKILNVLKRRDTKATFFVLGWVAERHPDLIRAIDQQGHEIASHGYGHQLVYDLTAEEFRHDVSRSLSILRDITGKECIGYRAPSFSLRTDVPWMWTTLCELGINYDSSIFPILHDRYGEPDAPRFPFLLKNESDHIVEFPLSTVRIAGRTFPVAGGGYFRLYPFALTRHAIRSINREGQPAIVYLHPWEVDPAHPKPPVSKLNLYRHRVGMASVLRKLDAILREFRFGPVRDVINRRKNLDYAKYLEQELSPFS